MRQWERGGYRCAAVLAAVCFYGQWKKTHQRVDTVDTVYRWYQPTKLLCVIDYIFH